MSSTARGAGFSVGMGGPNTSVNIDGKPVGGAPPPSDSSASSAGIIAASVLGFAVCVIAIGLVVFFVKSRKKSEDKVPAERKNSGTELSSAVATPSSNSNSNVAPVYGDTPRRESIPVVGQYRSTDSAQYQPLGVDALSNQYQTDQLLPPRPNEEGYTELPLNPSGQSFTTAFSQDYAGLKQVPSPSNRPLPTPQE